MSDGNEPFGSSQGNVLFSGLPLRCGPERAIEYLEALSVLGASVALQPELAERSTIELQQDHQESEGSLQVAYEAMKKASEKLRAGTLPTREKNGDPLHEYLPEKLVDLALDVAVEFGMPYADWHEEAMLALATFFAEETSNTVAECLQLLTSEDHRRWGFPEPWQPEHLARARRINPKNLLLGLHEIRKAPWRNYGGMVAGRVPTREYQRALRNVDRDVVIAHSLHDWLMLSSRRAEWISKAVSHLVTLSVPYAVPAHIDTMMKTVGRLYLDRQFGSMVLVCRSALEVAITHVTRRHSAPPQLKLGEAIHQLHRKGILDQSAKRAAEDLRVRGNKAVHEDLRLYDTPQHAFECLQRLTYVLNALRDELEQEAPAAEAYDSWNG